MGKRTAPATIKRNSAAKAPKDPPRPIPIKSSPEEIQRIRAAQAQEFENDLEDQSHRIAHKSPVDPYDWDAYERQLRRNKANGKLSKLDEARAAFLNIDLDAPQKQADPSPVSREDFEALAAKWAAFEQAQKQERKRAEVSTRFEDVFLEHGVKSQIQMAMEQVGYGSALAGPNPKAPKAARRQTEERKPSDYGAWVKTAREARGWSRGQLRLKILLHFEDAPTEDAISDLETGVSGNPHKHNRAKYERVLKGADKKS